MPRCRIIITRLIAFMAFMAITGSIISRICALLVNGGLRTGLLQAYADDRSARFLIILPIIFVAVIAYCQFFTRTTAGRKWMEWFLEVDKTIFGRGK
jgi:hypothetical protein